MGHFFILSFFYLGGLCLSIGGGSRERPPGKGVGTRPARHATAGL